MLSLLCPGFSSYYIYLTIHMNMLVPDLSNSFIRNPSIQHLTHISPPMLMLPPPFHRILLLSIRAGSPWASIPTPSPTTTPREAASSAAAGATDGTGVGVFTAGLVQSLSAHVVGRRFGDPSRKGKSQFWGE